MPVELAWAINASSVLVSVETVPRGAACACRCPDCGAPLVSKQGKLLAWHFAHETTSSCAGGGETMAHILAKQIIADELRLRLPADHTIFRGRYHSCLNEQSALFESAVLEEWRQGIRPDLTAQWDGVTVAVEVLVTHPCSVEKIDLCQQKRLPVVEIDLSRWNRDDFDDDEFKQSVLQTAPRKWLWHPAADTLRQSLLEQELAERAERERIDVEEASRRTEPEHLAEIVRHKAMEDRRRVLEEENRLTSERRRQAEDIRKAKESELALAPMRAMREVLRSNAEIALAHATSRGDPVGIALVQAWFDSFNESAP